MYLWSLYSVVKNIDCTKCSIMSWTDEKVGKLKNLWGKGQTASQIAEIIGGVSRNAVIGKAHRLNLEARAPSKQSNSPRSRENKQAPKRSPAPMSRKAKFNNAGHTYKGRKIKWD